MIQAQPFPLTRVLPGALLIAALCLPSMPAKAQSHTEQFGPYTVRSSSVSSQTLAPSSAREHGIEPAPDLAVLNVLVQHTDEQGHVRTVPADVKAQTRTLTGVTRDVPLKESSVNGYITYTGTYTFLPRQVIDLMITAQPRGTHQVLNTTYRERMWVRNN